MKNWGRKKWFRVLVRCAVAGASLLVLVYAAINWWGAREKQRAIAEARAAGVPVTLAEMMADMPPREENFAMIPFLAELEKSYGTIDPVENIPPSSARGRYEAMADPVFQRAWRGGAWRKGIEKKIDFSLMPADNPYGQSAVSFLKEYDRRHGDILAELREGLSRPYSRRPLVPEGFDGTDWFNLSEGLGMMGQRVIDGLALRAEAALMTGDPARAADSIVIGLRLLETTASHGSAMGALVEWRLFGLLKGSLKSGIREHAWSEDELERIRDAFLRMNPQESLQRAMKGEILMLQVWEGWRDDRRRFHSDIESYSNGLAWRIFFPDGWFDLKAAEVVRTSKEGYQVTAGCGPALSWWEAGERFREGATGKGGDWLSDPSLVFGITLERGSRAIVQWRLCVLACELESYYVRHGDYPVDLSGFPADIVRDPLHGTPFRYRRTEEGFLLYSIGPDGKDDEGGKYPLRGQSVDQPDWVW